MLDSPNESARIPTRITTRITTRIPTRIAHRVYQNGSYFRLFLPEKTKKNAFGWGIAREKMTASTKNHRVDSWVGVEFQGVFDIQNEPTCLVQKIRNLKIRIIDWRGCPRSNSGCTRVREGRERWCWFDTSNLETRRFVTCEDWSVIHGDWPVHPGDWAYALEQLRGNVQGQEGSRRDTEDQRGEAGK